MTESEFDNVTKIVLLSLMGLVLVFGVSFIVYHCSVIGPDADRTFVDKIGWITNQGAFHKQVDCWGEILYFIGDEQTEYNHSWMTRDRKTVVKTENLQEGVIYSTYEKHYFFLFMPDNFYYIESKDCGK